MKIELGMISHIMDNNSCDELKRCAEDWKLCQS